MTDSYTFRSGAPVDASAISRARSFAHGAADSLSVALAVKSDSDRDFHLDEAAAALDEAQRLLTAARQIEPPRVAPFSRAEMVDALFDIATPLSMRAR